VINAEHIIITFTVLLGVVTTAILSLLTAYFQWKAKKDISQVNDAVNHRHEKGHGALKLYDLVWENHTRSNELIEWKRGYDGGSFSEPAKVEKFVQAASDFQQHTTDEIQKLHNKVDGLEQRPPCIMHIEQDKDVDSR
jgi:hypothetical protein